MAKIISDDAKEAIDLAWTRMLRSFGIRDGVVNFSLSDLLNDEGAGNDLLPESGPLSLATAASAGASEDVTIGTGTSSTVDNRGQVKFPQGVTITTPNGTKPTANAAHVGQLWLDTTAIPNVLYVCIHESTGPDVYSWKSVTLV